MQSEYSNSSDLEVEEFYKIVSKNVKSYRNEVGLSQLDLTLEIGIKSVAFYSNCENNKQGKYINLEHLYRSAKALTVDICQLTTSAKPL